MRDLDISQLLNVSNNNLSKFNLVQPEASTRSFRPRCSGADNIPPRTSPLVPHSSSEIPVTSPSKQCKVCKRSVKGKRGLQIHLGRNPNCKRNVPNRELVPLPPHEPTSLPSAIALASKCPSTSVESLENMCGSGNHTKIKRHASGDGCGICHQLSIKDQIVSSSTHRIHKSVIPDDIVHCGCNSSNVIYLLTCRKCGLQYVGETAQELRCRIGKHKSDIRHPERDHTCRILIDHFSQGLCKNATFTVHILEKLSGDGRDDNQQVDSSVTRIRRKKETEWMLKLRTVYPYGLNDRIGDEYMFEKDNTNIFSRFPPLKRIIQRLKVRTKSDVSNTFVVDHFFYIVNESLRTNLRNTMNLIRVLLSSLKKEQCRLLFDRINDFLSAKHDTYRFVQFFEAALDIVKFKIGQPPSVSSQKKAPPTNRCHIAFDNKAVEYINLQKILHDKDVRLALPRNLKNDTPTVIYQLSETIRSKLLNHKKFVQSFDVNSFMSDNSVLPCECEHSQFSNPDHGHVICGDLNIVSDDKLRALFTKGPKYRVPQPFSCSKAKESIVRGLDECISSWSSRSNTSKAAFEEWKSRIVEKIDHRISSFVPKRKKASRSIFEDTSAQSCLSELQSKYVMVPIDKAANNIAFVCKRFYAQVLLNELGLTGSSTSTYTNISHRNPNDVISQHQDELKEQFNLSVDDTMKTLPDIYWLPKLHKTPVKFRFIIASKRCTTKILSKDVSAIFSLFQKQIDTYYKKVHFYSGIKPYWIVQNRDPVLQSVRKSVPRRSAKCISSFDFSTLYTKIPHDKLIDVLNSIIDFVFKGGTRKKVAIRPSGSAFWDEKDTPSLRTYTKDSIKNAVAYLIKNCYFKLGDKLFRQDIGIPMGSDPAPAFANLFLFHYESSWLNTIKKTNYTLARKFGQVYRYIDDLVALNDGHSFEAYFKDIYPEELQLNKENAVDTSTDFLDLHIEIVDGIFTTKIFDKRDHFGFNITRLPYRESNIPCKMFYSSIAAECLRICRATSASVDAISSIHTLFTRMTKQGADMVRMKSSIVKMFNRHQINQKFGIHDNSFTNNLFQ